MSQDLPVIDVIIPAFNEEDSIGLVLDEIPSFVRKVVVVNNNSTDHTSLRAKEGGAVVLDEPRRGYGTACLTGIAYLSTLEVQPQIVVFLDGDYSDYPEETGNIIRPIVEGKADMVIGSRARGIREPGSMTFPQVFGNFLATNLMRWIYGVNYSDLGPFRAIRWESLLSLDMMDKDYGWTVEMQVKAAKQQLRHVEVPVNYKKRIGKSKVSGTIKGTVMAGYKILWTLFRFS
ncbi:MAG TPA: glycosyltransferase family 2 protein [Cyclobacteriaceae bacterium]|nr:glycosyltransferase family 2 protein [Cyclobacteriaceae bacterium]